MTRVILHIDRLFLNGFHVEQRDAIAHSLRSELVRLLTEPAMAERLGTARNVERIRTRARASPRTRHLARPAPPSRARS